MKKILFLIMILTLVCSFASAQEVDAKQIMDNLYMTGTIGKIYDMIVDMEVYAPIKDNPDAEEVIELIMSARAFFASPNKIRAEITMPVPGAQSDIYYVTIRNGEIAWKYTPYEPWPVDKIADDNHHSYLLPFSIDVQPQDQYRTYTFIKEEKEKDRDAYVISIVNEKDPEAQITTVWVDKERYVPLKVEFTVQEKDSEIKRTHIYKDYKQIYDGRWMPFKIEKYENGKMGLYMVYKDLAVNTNFPLHLFNPEMPELLMPQSY